MSGCPVILRILNLCPKDVGRTLLDWTTMLILGLSFFFTSWRTTHLLWQKHSTLRSRCFWQFFVQPMSDHCPTLLLYQLESENIVKGTTDPGVEWFLHKYWSIFILRISTIHQLQNLNQTSASRLNLNVKSWPNLASADVLLVKKWDRSLCSE